MVKNVITVEPQPRRTKPPMLIANNISTRVKPRIRII
jgi:hypothetical protein